MTLGTPLLRLDGLKKVFPNGTVALHEVSLNIERGEVLGLLGANGAGKSTLIKILSGVMQSSSGNIEWKGRPIKVSSPRDANNFGIATIHQHIPLVTTLSVLENIFLSDTKWQRDSKEYRIIYHALCTRINYYIDPDIFISELSIGQRQMVAIMTALVSGADLIVMDEPTASLAVEERELVYRMVRHLSKQENKAILFVSHFLDEVVELTDRVTVLRDGRVVLVAKTQNLDESKIAEAIVGQEVIAMERESKKRIAKIGAIKDATPMLELRELASPGMFAPISLCLARGEVIGIAGLLGSGRSELLHAVFGADSHSTGEIFVKGSKQKNSIGAAVKAGMALVPEDRFAQGLVPNFEIWKNITLPALNSVSLFGFLPIRSKEIERGWEAIKLLNIKADSPEVLVTELSGGNAQKVTIGKWLFSDVEIFLDRKSVV